MQQTYGDIWEYAYKHHVDAVCVATNLTVRHGKLIMGAGQAKEATDRFPGLAVEWGSYYGTDWFCGQNLTAVYDPIRDDRHANYFVVAFPTKQRPAEMSTLAMIEASAVDLLGAAADYEWGKVLLPRPGCGLGGLRWPVVSAKLHELLDDRFVAITNDPALHEERRPHPAAMTKVSQP